MLVVLLGDVDGDIVAAEGVGELRLGCEALLASWDRWFAGIHLESVLREVGRYRSSCYGEWCLSGTS